MNAIAHPIPVSHLVAAAQDFSEAMAALDRRLRRIRSTVPAPADQQAAVAAFETLARALAEAEASGPVSDDDVRACRTIAGHWLFRSRIWNRAFHKPHGHAGDFMVIEWMYDLETDACATPFQPAIVNCLDHIAKVVPSTASVWERRRWFAALLERAYERNGSLRVLDLAGGGARYLRDFLDAAPRPGFSLTLIDQDPAAIAYCAQQSLARWRDQVDLHCTSIRDLAPVLAGKQFDLVISAGLFDYLTPPVAQPLLALAAQHLHPNGQIAICNLHKDDSSRLVKSWLVDWPLLYRDHADCVPLFPPDFVVETSVSSNRGLIYAIGTGSRV
jgi:SAM-dependent methyltransferase